MDLPARFRPSANITPRCAELLAMAERELSAFFDAVNKLFGSEQAGLSVDAWLHELTDADRLPISPREWRGVTVKVLSRLAGQLQTASLSAEVQAV